MIIVLKPNAPAVERDRIITNLENGAIRLT